MSRIGGSPELWAGLECTVNRVGDRYFNQMERNGHLSRADADLEQFASLGVTAVRYPLLWELVAPNGLATAQWDWVDARMRALEKLRLRPIVGLVHHGSGPPSTSLVDPTFPKRLAEYAGAVARRYPWARDYTPINEPLTTARFSGLYGHWYPHGRDAATFVRCLLVQCRAVVESMRAIRQVTPEARLVLTEDMGRTFGSPRLGYQVDHENERRWLSVDLLSGRVDSAHPLWPWLVREAGASEAELAYFLRRPTPPDVVGLNYYLTSDRVLDDRLELYPEWARGGNGRDAYADIEAVRGRPEGIFGHRAVLAQAWERYRLPVALTEVHLGSTREEQLRWLREAWEAARSLRSEGAAVEAITVWSLLGSFDWNSLVTRDSGFYEPGPFDVRAPVPRATALARMARGLATEGRFDHPVLASPGWWRRPDRLLPALLKEERTDSGAPGAAPPLLIVGATGTLGQGFARTCLVRGLAHRLLSRREVDIAVRQSVDAALEKHQPWAVVNAAGYVRVDDAESDAERCFRENAVGPAVLAAACKARGIRLLTFSSDLVFDGRRGAPYLEHDPVAPLNVYGDSKASAEGTVRAALSSALIVRTSAFFSPWDRYNFITLALQTLARGERFRAAEDWIISPTYLPELIDACLDLLIDGEEGLWHLANRGAVSWAALARQAAARFGLDPSLVEGVSGSELRLPARRPAYSALESARGSLLSSLDQALERYHRELLHRPDAAGVAALSV